MKALFDLDKLVDFVFKQLDGSFSKPELKELLSVGEDGYQKDSPLSVGKSLKIISVEFSGKKSISGEEIDFKYERQFDNGVYLWVGDNLVGKSSIFKVIKLALTGSNGLKPDIDSWINEIWLEFGLGTNAYTVKIARNKQGNFHFSLKNGSRQRESTIQEDGEQVLFEGGIGNYTDYMEAFFFRELDYYALQWTQHASQKDNPNLLTSSASWKTYFKSIYLEAEDYNVLVFGKQSELIFQMLLGLELTYPINRLKVKRELLQHQLGLAKNTLPAAGEEATTKAKDKEEKQKELAKVVADLEALKSQAEEATKPKQSDNERKLEQAREQYRKAVARRFEIEEESNRLNDLLVVNQRKFNNIRRQIEDYGIDVNKKIRAITDLKDYLELGAFFNGLEVKSCPNCNHAVEKYKVQEEKTNGTCRLCGDHDITVEEIDRDKYEEQLERLRSQYEALNNDQSQLKAELSVIDDQIQRIQTSLARLEAQASALPFASLQKQIDELQRAINTSGSKPYDWNQHMTKLSELTAKKTILEQALASYQNDVNTPTEQQQVIEQKIKALEIAEEELKRQRNERSAGPVQTFEKLYLEQLHALGLPHYEKVELKPDFKVVYFMHGNELDFDQISPGEQLRAKLSLYISLIEMDITHQLGRHPRFIILDSPAKEEADPNFVEGIKSTLEFIQTRFGNDLQVFVGTAQRGLASAADKERVEEKGEKEFFF